MIQLKITLPDYTTVVNANEEQTVKELVELILDKFDCPRIYSEVCLLFKTIGDHWTLLHSDMNVSAFYVRNNDQYQYKFKVAYVPRDYHLKDLHPKFQKLYYRQINHYVVNGLYGIPSSSRELPIVLAAYTCAVEHGLFNPEKHASNFLSKVLTQILPQYLLSCHSPRELENKIFHAWNDLSQQENITRNQCINGYLMTSQKYLPQFGSIVIKSKDSENNNQTIYIAIGQTEVGLYNPQSNTVALQASYKQTDIVYEDMMVKIVNNTNLFKLTCCLQDFQQLVNYIQNSSFYQQTFNFEEHNRERRQKHRHRHL